MFKRGDKVKVVNSVTCYGTATPMHNGTEGRIVGVFKSSLYDYDVLITKGNGWEESGIIISHKESALKLINSQLTFVY